MKLPPLSYLNYGIISKHCRRKFGSTFKHNLVLSLMNEACLLIFVDLLKSARICL